MVAVDRFHPNLHLYDLGLITNVFGQCAFQAVARKKKRWSVQRKLIIVNPGLVGVRISMVV